MAQCDSAAVMRARIGIGLAEIRHCGWFCPVGFSKRDSCFACELASDDFCLPTRTIKHVGHCCMLRQILSPVVGGAGLVTNESVWADLGSVAVAEGRVASQT